MKPDFKEKNLKIIEDVIENINQSGLLSRGAGYCFAMSEMVQTLLSQQGIDSRLAEVKLTVMSKNPPCLKLVGHDEVINSKETDRGIDTHVICITETNPSYLIDLSIFYVLQPFKSIPFILAEINLDTTSKKILEFEIFESTWIYEEKTRPKLPVIYQQNLLGRIKQEKNLRKELRWLKILIVSALLISSTNAIRGGYDFYQKYIVEDNDWGPGTIFPERLNAESDKNP